MNTSYLFLAEGFEEIEAIAPVDIMRRAGMTVYTVSITDDLIVKGAHGMEIKADKLISEIDSYDAEWLILPGGMPGATNLAACGELSDILKNQWIKGGKIAAICASPAVVLGPLGILRGQDATCYPTFRADLVKSGAKYVDQRVVESGNLVTSNGPSSALLFGYSIVSITLGNDVASSVASGMLV
ncbi:MAG: DJ-1/PfpI family protein [Muribaculum sp.]|nr:DJ-1/PfpI family protein [Muribaculum sp.]